MFHIFYVYDQALSRKMLQMPLKCRHTKLDHLSKLFQGSRNDLMKYKFALLLWIIYFFV